MVRMRLLKKKKPVGDLFSEGMYDWSLFITNLFIRVRTKLQIDFESFMILHIVAGNYIYDWNRYGSKSFDQVSSSIEKVVSNKLKINKITVTNIASILKIPRETVKRKILGLVEKKLLVEKKNKSIAIGEAYQNYFENFVFETTQDVSKLVTKWKTKGILDKLIEFNE